MDDNGGPRWAAARRAMNAAVEAFRSGRTFLTPGGTETYLMFQQGYPLRLSLIHI